MVQRMNGASAAGEHRRRRSRDETRQLFLAAGAHIVVLRLGEREAGSGLFAGVKATDILAELNRDESDAPITTGAFYQIWKSQGDFQKELVTHVMEQISTPGGSALTELTMRLIAEGRDADDIVQTIADEDFRLTQDSPELFLAVALGAVAPISLVREAQEDANRQFVGLMTTILSSLLAYAGRRLRPGREMSDLIWALEALMVGYLLRSRTHADIPERTDREGRSARAAAYLGIVLAFTEPGAGV